MIRTVLNYDELNNMEVFFDLVINSASFTMLSSILVFTWYLGVTDNIQQSVFAITMKLNLESYLL